MMFYAGMLGLIWAYEHYNERDRERVKENIWEKALKRQQEDAGKQHRLHYNNPSDDFHKHSLSQTKQI